MINVAATPKKRQRAKPVKPHFLAELYKALRTHDKVGQAIGLSGSIVGKYLALEECPPYVEEAAKSYVTKNNPTGQKTFHLIARVDHETRNRIQWILEVSNSTFTFHEEK